MCVCERERERKQRVGEKGRGTRERGRRKRSESPPLLEKDQKKSPETKKRDREESRNPGVERGGEREESVAREICADELGGGRRSGGGGRWGSRGGALWRGLWQLKGGEEEEATPETTQQR